MSEYGNRLPHRHRNIEFSEGEKNNGESWLQLSHRMNRAMTVKAKPF
jgi:hypothetical protein